ncbi:DUF4412 domain-containing protein [Lewinella sp. IMCC34191]|uniref:DUF4412 domain-containing protein n=1 Tax=Lewinella sp. IMCC34191 TaxID=2259172 RepID=UPI000E288BB4|nr:DUF4412 domain-containing protein [Lewinella sp. IMCC34191]
MKYRITLLILLLACVSFTAEAQGTVERAKKRTEKKASNRVDQKIDNEVDKAFNAIEGLFKKKNKAAEPAEDSTEAMDPEEERAANAVAGIFTGGNEDFEPFQNDELFTLLMVVTEVKRNKDSEARIRLGASTDKIAMATEDPGQGSSHMIFDTQDGKTTMITTDKRGKKSGYRMRMPNLGRFMDKAQEDMTDRLEIERTGERRTIDGYDCELIIVEDTKENTTTRSWITMDIPVSSREVFGTISRMMGGKGTAGQAGMPIPPGMADLIDGFPIESSTVDGNKTFTMHITEIRTGANIDRSLFEAGDVEIQEMGF